MKFSRENVNYNSGTICLMWSIYYRAKQRANKISSSHTYFRSESDCLLVFPSKKLLWSALWFLCLSMATKHDFISEAKTTTKILNINSYLRIAAVQVQVGRWRCTRFVANAGKWKQKWWPSFFFDENSNWLLPKDDDMLMMEEDLELDSNSNSEAKNLWIGQKQL